jgi:hypothetical protein
VGHLQRLGVADEDSGFGGPAERQTLRGRLLRGRLDVKTTICNVLVK